MTVYEGLIVGGGWKGGGVRDYSELGFYCWYLAFISGECI